MISLQSQTLQGQTRQRKNSHFEKMTVFGDGFFLCLTFLQLTSFFVYKSQLNHLNLWNHKHWWQKFICLGDAKLEPKTADLYHKLVHYPFCLPKEPSGLLLGIGIFKKPHWIRPVVRLVQHHVSHSNQTAALKGQTIGHRGQNLPLMLPPSTRCMTLSFLWVQNFTHKLKNEKTGT